MHRNLITEYFYCCDVLSDYFPDDIDDIPVLFLRVFQKCNVERGDVKKGAAKSEVDE